MKTARISIITALTAIGLAMAAPAMAQGFAFSFDTGNVRMGYSDGYWDNGHHWHAWRNAREAAEFRRMYHDRYEHTRHDRYRNGGWRDSDGDGVPNRFDDHPNNPYRQ